MLVSIITVVYNGEKAIENCINSVITQDYKNIQYIIIDGNSNDNTCNIINKYRDKIDIFISENDKGIYDAINKGISYAKGDIIGLLHADDLFFNDKIISKVVNNFNLDIDLVFSDSVYINDLNKIIRYYSSKNFKNWKFKFGLMPSHPTCYIRRKILFDVKYDINFKIAGDFDLLLRLFVLKKINYLYIPEIWVIMKIGGLSTKNFKSKVTITKEILYSFKKNKLHTNYLFLNLRFLIKYLEILLPNKKMNSIKF
jgi:glycosyltransferase involved in cell wall biosynthesis